jgi:hypothetical protein
MCLFAPVQRFVPVLGCRSSFFPVFALTPQIVFPIIQHEDLKIKVFFGAGSAELDDPVLAAYPIVGSMTRFSERLSLRRYPSLHITNKIFDGETHYTAILPVLSWGLRSLFKDEFSAPDMGAYVDQLIKQLSS